MQSRRPIHGGRRAGCGKDAMQVVWRARHRQPASSEPAGHPAIKDQNLALNEFLCIPEQLPGRAAYIYMF